MVLIIKRLCAFILALALAVLNCGSAFADNELDISAEKAILIHEDGEILFNKKADKRSLIASTTKIMTAIIAIENCELSEVVDIKGEYCGLEGSSMYLKEGEKYTVEELLKGLMLVSGNDAAMALACHTAKSEKEFVKLMNKKASELGMTDTHYENPHGLDAKRHYSSASDLAKLMAYCMKNETFAEITAMGSTQIGEQTFINHNKLLKLCKGCIGGKTGFTEAAGRCLVSCCERNGTRLICVTLKAPDDWNDHIKLYNRAFELYSKRNISENISFTVPVISGDAETAFVLPKEYMAFLPLSGKISYKAEMPSFVFAPIQAGDRAGKLKLYCDEKLIGETELYYRDSIMPAL